MAAHCCAMSNDNQNNILDVVGMPFIIEANTASLTASIGIAFFPDHGEGIETLLASADKALYAIKHSGKNGSMCAPD